MNTKGMAYQHADFGEAGVDVPAVEADGPQSVGRPNYSDLLLSLSAVQKQSNGAPAYSRYVNRPLGRRLAALAYQAGLTPNQLTATSAAFTFCGIGVLAVFSPSVLIAVTVALCLVIGYAFDAADGQLARLRGGGSALGEWLDHMVDSCKITSLHLAVLISFYRFFGLQHQVWLLVPIGYCIVASVMFFGMTLIDQLRRSRAGVDAARHHGQQHSNWRSLFVIPTDYGLLCVLFLLVAVPLLFQWVYLVLFICNAGFLVLALGKWFAEMRRLTERIGRKL